MTSLTNFDGKRVLVTGGTGTIGSRVVHNLLEEFAKVTVFSRDQNKQFKMNYDIASKRVQYVNGDVCDKELLLRVTSGVDFVIHCAASKHLPLCETNVDSAVKVNVEGTRNVLECCRANGVKRFLLLSTDKSVHPSSVMGATKFLAERLAIEFNQWFPCSVVRLGNVFASNGSVVPTFLDRIKFQLPLVVNDPVAIRYFMTRNEAGRFIVDRLKDMTGGEIFVKKMKFMTILQLAEVMRPDPGYKIKIGTLTQGEKRKEDLISQEEARKTVDMGSYYIVSEKGDIKPANYESVLVKQFTNEEIKEMMEEALK